MMRWNFIPTLNDDGRNGEYIHSITYIEIQWCYLVMSDVDFEERKKCFREHRVSSFKYISIKFALEIFYLQPFNESAG